MLEYEDFGNMHVARSMNVAMGCNASEIPHLLTLHEAMSSFPTKHGVPEGTCCPLVETELAHMDSGRSRSLI